MADRISSIADESSLKKEFDFIIGSLKTIEDTITDLNKKSINLEGAVKGSGSLAELVKKQNEVKETTDNVGKAFASYAQFVKQADDYIKRYNGTTERHLSITSQLAKSQAEVAKAENAINRERQRSEASARKAAKAVEDSVSAYKQLSNAAAAATKAYKDLAAAHGAEHQLVQQAKKDAADLNARLYEIDRAVNLHQRNVGNYASAFNGLGNSIGQVARELPNFASNMQTGFLAISNNLPILADEIARVKTENAALAAQGKPTVSVFKQIASAVFSWQTALIVGITALVAYGKEIGEWAKSIFKGKEAIDKVKFSTETLNKALSDTGGAFAKAVSEVSELRINLELAKAGFLDKEKVLKQYNSTIGKTTGEVKTLDEAERELVKNGDAYIKMTLYKAAASLALEEAAKKTLEAEKARRQSEKEFGTLGTAITSVSPAANRFGTPSAEAFREADKRAKELREARKQAAIKDAEESTRAMEEIATKFQKDAAEIAKKMNFDFFGGDQDDKKKTRTKKPTDFTNENLKAEEDFTKALYEQLKIRAEIEAETAQGIAEDDANSLDTRLRAYNAFAAARLKAAGFGYSAEFDVIQQSLDKIAEIERKEAGKRTNEEKKLLLQKDALLQQQANLTDLYELAQTKIVQDNVNARVELVRKYGKEAVGAAEAALKAISGVNSYKAGDSDVEAAQKKFGQIEQYARMGLSVASSANDLLNAQTQQRIAAINAEIEAINKRAEAEIAAIERSTLSNEEKERKIADVKARTYAKEQELRQRAVNEQRRAAEREKAIRIATMIIDTAAAVVALLKTPPLAIAAGIAGAAQIALAIATPIPAFAEGGEMKKDGPAVYGEKGTEMLVSKEGNLIGFTPDKATLGWLQAGTKVIDHEATMNIVKNYGLTMPRTDPNRITDPTPELKEAFMNGSKMVASAIHKKQFGTQDKTWFNEYYNKKGRS